MSETFDPYRKWLGILPKDQPAHYYRLLGIPLFENDPDVIENAANRQMLHVRTFQTGKQAKSSQRILNEISAAKLCLLSADKKVVYDKRLKGDLKARKAARSDVRPPATLPPKAAAPPARAPDKPDPIVEKLVGGAQRTASRLHRGRHRRDRSPLAVILGLLVICVMIILLAIILSSNGTGRNTKSPKRGSTGTSDAPTRLVDVQRAFR